MIKKTIVIGLCGRSGSGKGYVCGVFSRFGIPSIDTDKVYRDLLNDKNCGCLAEIVLRFGEEVLDDDKSLDRRALAKIVFDENNVNALSELNAITHKYILEKTQLLLEKAGEDGVKAIIIDAPVLFESGFDKLCDMVLCVSAPDSVCIERICSRDNRSEKEAQSRLNNQKKDSELKSICDFCIVNDGEADVENQVLRFMEKYISGDSYGTK